MTADIINLRKARKQKARAAKDQQSAANRVRFGRTRAEREHAEAGEALARRRLDALRREPSPGPVGGEPETPED